MHGALPLSYRVASLTAHEFPARLQSGVFKYLKALTLGPFMPPCCSGQPDKISEECPLIAGKCFLTYR